MKRGQNIKNNAEASKVYFNPVSKGASQETRATGNCINGTVKGRTTLTSLSTFLPA